MVPLLPRQGEIEPWAATQLSSLLSQGRNLGRNPSSSQGKQESGLAKPGGFFLPTFCPPTATLWSQWAVWITPGPLSTLAAARCSGSIPEPWPAVGHCLRKSETCEALAPGRETPSTGLPSACLAFPEQEPLLGRGDCPPRRSSPPPSLPTGSSTEFPFYR